MCIAALFAIANVQQQVYLVAPQNEWMYKQALVNLCNRILLSNKNGQTIN